MEFVTDFDFVVKSLVVMDCSVGFVKEVDEDCLKNFLFDIKVSAVD